jgi:TatD DNase family protein
MLIDSHCHLNFSAFDQDRAKVLARASEAGIIGLVNPAIDLASSYQVVELAKELPNLFAAVGFHPNDAAGLDESALSQLRELAGQPEVVALGEIGLDYYWDKVPRQTQRRVFEAQLTLAKDVGRPVIIHQRESVADTMAVLRGWGSQQDHPGLVLHSFSGDMRMAEEALELGFYLGISGPVTFKNNRQLPEIVAATPPERLLVETDAPFLSPHPFRGKRNEPARVELIAARLAELKNLSFGEMSRQLTKNTISLFNLPNLANTDRNSGDVGPP